MSSVDHKELPQLKVGLTYSTATDALHTVQDFALSQNKSVRVDQRSGLHRKIVCTSDGCSMFVRIYRKQMQRTRGVWYISSMDLTHKNCVAVSNPTRRQITALPTFASAVSADANVTASALVHQVQSRDGIALGKKVRTLYRAKDAVSTLSSDAVVTSYQKMPSLLQKFAELNPGSIAIVERDRERRFLRALVAAKAFVDATPAMQRVFGVDCAHSKCLAYSGVQMLLVGRDGDMRNVTLAFALVPAEDYESYYWFFTTLRAVGLDLTETPVFCDRHVALLSVAETMGLKLRYCTLHIIRNVLSKFQRFTHRHKNLIWQIQSAKTAEDYLSRLSWLGVEVGGEVMQYVKDIAVERWCVHANIGVAQLYGWRTSNFVESAFGTQLVKGIRSLYPFAFVETMCGTLVDECYLRSQNAAKWNSDGLRVTPAATQMYDQQSANIGQYAVQHASEDTAYVWNTTNPVRNRRRVNKSTLTCTCAYRDQTGIPCRHMIAALHDARELDRVYEGFDRCYLVATYVRAFRNKAILVPLDCELTVEKDLLPPIVTRRPGRPRVKRIRSSGEAGETSVYRCSKCHQSGHNSRRCVL